MVNDSDIQALIDELVANGGYAETEEIENGRHKIQGLGKSIRDTRDYLESKKSKDDNYGRSNTLRVEGYDR